MKIAFTCSSDKETDDDMCYLFVIKAAGEGDEAEDWTGKMNETKRTIMSVGADIKKDVAVLNTKVDTKFAENNTKVDIKFAEVKTMLNLILKNVEPIIEKY